MPAGPLSVIRKITHAGYAENGAVPENRNTAQPALFMAEAFPVLGRRAARYAAEALDEIVWRIEGQAIGDFCYGELGGFQDDFCARDPGIPDIGADGLAGFAPEFFREIVLG